MPEVEIMTDERIRELERTVERLTERVELLLNRIDHLEDQQAGEDRALVQVFAIKNECERQFQKIADERGEALYRWWSP